MPRRRNVEPLVQGKERDLLLTLINESYTPLKCREIATGNKVSKGGDMCLHILDLLIHGAALFFVFCCARA